MTQRIARKCRLAPAEIGNDRAARAQFAHHPGRSELTASGEYIGPMSLEEYLKWR